MLLYVNDVIHLAKDSQEDMLKLNQVYRLKGFSGPPDRYIGANIDKFQLEDGITVWYITCVEYLKGYIKNLYLKLECNKAYFTSFVDRHNPYPS